MIDLVIDGTRALAPRIAEFTLRATSGGLLPTFSAGAHVEIETAAGWRAYSLLDVPPSPWMYRIAVELQEEGAGGSIWMHRRSVGDRLVAREPRNDFPLPDRTDACLLIAGGIGVAPILCMARILARRGDRFDLHYVGVDSASMAYRSEVQALGGHVSIDGGDPGRGLALDSLLADPSTGRHLLACGPPQLIDMVLRMASRLGWSPGNIQYQSFANVHAIGIPPAARRSG